MRSSGLGCSLRRCVPSALVGAFLAVSASPAMAQTDQEIADAFDIAAFSLQDLVIEQAAPQHAFVNVDLGGEEFVLSVFRTSVRSADFRMMVQDETGLHEVAPPVSSVFRGTVLNEKGSRAVGSIVDGQFNGMIRMGDSIWTVQPLTDAFDGANAGTHVVYNNADLVWDEDWMCGVDEFVADVPVAPSGPGAGEIKVAEIAFDTDFEYFQDLGSNQNTVISTIENLVANMINIYEAEVGISYQITEIIVRTTSNDPYTTTDPGTFLNQFRSHWLNNQQSVQRDLAHLWTGKNLQGGVIGIAFLNGVCNSNGFGISERFTTSTGLLVGLMAHEAGHNWSAGHCDQQGGGCFSDCAIMCSAINACGNGVTTFGTCASNSITNYANSGAGACLDDGGPPDSGGDANWSVTVTNNDGDNVVEPGETATVTLTMNFVANQPQNFIGLAATIFDTIGSMAANTGTITDWAVLNNLAELTGDLTTTDGVSLFGTNAGQLTIFGDFTGGTPLDILEFEWQPNSFDGQVAVYSTVTDVVQAWEGDDLVSAEAFDWNFSENSAVIVVGTGTVCEADCNEDGSLNILDFTCFQALFASGDSAADCNNDGSLNILDFTCFQAAFAAGCP